MAQNIDQALLKSSWQLFDKNGTGMLTADEVALVLYSVGLTPTEKEGQEFGTSLQDASGNVSWDRFQQIFTHCKNDDEATARYMLAEAFKIFDKDEMGTPSLNDVRSILTSIGEPLSYDQMDQLASMINVDDKGRFKSSEFIDMLMTKWK